MTNIVVRYVAPLQKKGDLLMASTAFKTWNYTCVVVEHSAPRMLYHHPPSLNGGQDRDIMLIW